MRSHKLCVDCSAIVMTLHTCMPSHALLIMKPRWGLCALRHGIQISMEAILTCHPARCTEWLDCHPKSRELWRICTGPINMLASVLNFSSTCRSELMMLRSCVEILRLHPFWRVPCSASTWVLMLQAGQLLTPFLPWPESLSLFLSLPSGFFRQGVVFYLTPRRKLFLTVTTSVLV